MTQQEFQQRYTYDPVTDKLGEGGFGSVFKAYDNHLDCWVALKIAKVNPRYENIRLKKEVEMVAKLPTHPNIARYEECYTFSSFDGEYDFGILRYYEEGNLQQLLRRDAIGCVSDIPDENNCVSIEQRIAILTQILEGIEFLHHNHIIHRDLKLQNILIVRRGNEFIPKITDFGISKRLNINKSTVFTNSIAGVGTLAYASPEQLNGRKISKNTDLWSFGVIVFQVFTGNLPFTSGELSSTSEAGRMELFRQINSGKLSNDIHIILEPWQTLVRRCLVINTTQRIKNTQEAQEILTGAKARRRESANAQNDKTQINPFSNSLKSSESSKSIVLETLPVKGGPFSMGHTQLTLSDFNIGKYPVTQTQWKAVMGNNPSYFKGDNLPVEQVSWNDVQEFIRKLNKQTGKNYRLPTEAEWEYACRGGVHTTHHKYSGSNTVNEVAWYYGNAGEKTLDERTWDFNKLLSNKNQTHPVGVKSPNELGIYDMNGNVWEWCSDWYDDYDSGSGRVIRGGSWGNVAASCRATYRDCNNPNLRGSNLGFRLVLP